MTQAGTEDVTRARAALERHLGVSLDERAVDVVATRVPVPPGHAPDLELVVPSLRSSWWAVTAGPAVDRRLRTQLPRTVLTLEEHDLDRYDRSRDWWLRDMPSLSDTVARMDDLDVVHAEALGGNAVPSTISVSGTGADDGAGDPDAFAAALVALGSAPVGAAPRYVVVWTGAPWVAGVRAARDRWVRTEDQAPSWSPAATRPGDEVWLLHDPTGRGWRWDGVSWEQLGDLHR